MFGSLSNFSNGHYLTSPHQQDRILQQTYHHNNDSFKAQGNENVVSAKPSCPTIYPSASIAPIKTARTARYVHITEESDSTSLVGWYITAIIRNHQMDTASGTHTTWPGTSTTVSIGLHLFTSYLQQSLGPTQVPWRTMIQYRGGGNIVRASNTRLFPRAFATGAFTENATVARTWFLITRDGSSLFFFWSDLPCFTIAKWNIDKHGNGLRSSLSPQGLFRSHTFIISPIFSIHPKNYLEDANNIIDTSDVEKHLQPASIPAMTCLKCVCCECQTLNSSATRTCFGKTTMSFSCGLCKDVHTWEG